MSRACVLTLLVAAPLAFGAVHDWARVPFWSLCCVAGLASWMRARLAASRGEDVPALPGRGLLVALSALVLFQLVRLPAPLLGLVSPGSLELYWSRWGAYDYYWLPITVSQRGTIRGLAFLVAVSMLYAAVFRDFRERRWARRLVGAVVGVAAVMTLVGFLQRGSANPGRIYGLWEPNYSDAVFGPYVNRTHYAGYVVMAVPLALALAVEGFRRTSASWRRRGLIALGEAEASRGVLWTSGALFIAAGILNCGSRTGIGVLVLTGLIMPLAFFRRSLLAATLVVGVVGLVAYASADLGWLPEAFQARGLEATRIVVWRDMWPIVADFPLFGVGLNAFGRAYRAYQTIYPWDYWAEAHNEYYQALLDMGLLGACLTAGLLWILFTSALRAAPRSALQAGLLGAVSAQAVANVVDFNWQIPANAATFAALAGLTLACEHEERRARESSGSLSRSEAPSGSEAADPTA